MAEVGESEKLRRMVFSIDEALKREGLEFLKGVGLSSLSRDARHMPLAIRAHSIDK